MSAPVFYTLLQLPGLALLLIGLSWAIDRDWLEPLQAGLAVLVWVLKDVLLYPVYRPALAPPPTPGGGALVGASAVVTVALTPRGQIRVAGERWSAVLEGHRSGPLEPGHGLPAGSRVRVVAARGLVLVVAPCPATVDGART